MVKKKITKKKKKFSHTVRVTFKGIKKYKAVKVTGGKNIRSPEVEKAIQLGKKHLLKKFRDKKNWDSAKWDGTDKRFKNDSHMLGTFGLMYFAILRADADPNKKDIEKDLLKIVLSEIFYHGLCPTQKILNLFLY